ncbi:MAG: hypothetical protein M0R40_08535 [Firmicutes bacterium]|nr:hypothetical protein [Bacillota bacterium]
MQHHCKKVIDGLKLKYQSFKWTNKSSGKDAVTYLLTDKDERMYVKVSSGNLIKNQVDMLLYLEGRLPVPKVIEYDVGCEYGYVIMSEIKGVNFKEYLSCITPKRAVEIYADAYGIISESGITHGDFCPLNIIIGEGEKIAGFVDFEKGAKCKSGRDLDESVFIINRHYGKQYVKYFFQLIGGNQHEI